VFASVRIGQSAIGGLWVCDLCVFGFGRMGIDL